MVLCIVDMQPVFEAANNPKTLLEVKKLILRAIKTNSKILFLEYYFPEKKLKHTTHPELLALVKNYNNFAILSKDNDDGSEEILDSLSGDARKFQYKFCGVNTDVCVFKTVKNLSIYLKSKNKIKIVKNACWASTVSYHETGLRQLQYYSKLV